MNQTSYAITRRSFLKASGVATGGVLIGGCLGGGSGSSGGGSDDTDNGDDPFSSDVTNGFEGEGASDSAIKSDLADNELQYMIFEEPPGGRVFGAAIGKHDYIHYHRNKNDDEEVTSLHRIDVHQEGKPEESGTIHIGDDDAVTIDMDDGSIVHAYESEDGDETVFEVDDKQSGSTFTMTTSEILEALDELNDENLD